MSDIAGIIHFPIFFIIVIIMIIIVLIFPFPPVQIKLMIVSGILFLKLFQ